MSDEILNIFDEPVTTNMYYLLLVVKGKADKMVDFRDLQISDNQLLFLTPWQIHTNERNIISGVVVRVGPDMYGLPSIELSDREARGLYNDFVVVEHSRVVEQSKSAMQSAD